MKAYKEKILARSFAAFAAEVANRWSSSLFRVLFFLHFSPLFSSLCIWSLYLLFMSYLLVNDTKLVMFAVYFLLFSFLLLWVSGDRTCNHDHNVYTRSAVSCLQLVHAIRCEVPMFPASWGEVGEDVMLEEELSPIKWTSYANHAPEGIPAE